MAHTLGLALRTAGEGVYLGFPDAVARDRLAAGHILNFLFTEVVAIGPADLGHAVAGRARRTGPRKPAVNYVGVGVGVNRIARHISRCDDLAGGVVRHAPEHARQILEHLERVRARLEIDVAGKSRLLAALPVADHLVAVLRDGIQLPLVDLIVADIAAQAIPVIDDDVAIDPGRAVRPGQLKSAVPGTGVSPGRRVVVARHLDDSTANPECPLRDVRELAGVDLDADQRRVGVLQLGVDHLGVARNRGVGLGRALGRVGSGTPNADCPTFGRGRQIDPVGALVASGGFAAESRRQHLNKITTISRKLNDVIDGVAVGVAVALLLVERGNPELQTDPGQLKVVDCLCPRLVRFQLYTDRVFSLDRRKAGDVILIGLARALLPGDTAEIQAAVGVRQRRLVQVSTGRR